MTVTVASPRRGSGVSDKHIRIAVLKGRLVSITQAGSEEVLGFVCGLDDYHIALIPRDHPDQSVLFPKGNITIRIFHEDLLSSEPEELRKVIDSAVGPFRKSIEQHDHNKTL